MAILKKLPISEIRLKKNPWKQLCAWFEKLLWHAKCPVLYSD